MYKGTYVDVYIFFMKKIWSCEPVTETTTVEILYNDNSRDGKKVTKEYVDRILKTE